MSFLKKLNRLDALFKKDNYVLSSGDVNPVGHIIILAADLSGSVPDNYLYCDGSSLSRTTYSGLFSVISTNWGTASGSTFNLPDCRGYVLRGHADGESSDLDRAARTALNTGGETGDKVGTYQADQNKAHTHTWVNAATNGNSGSTTKSIFAYDNASVYGYPVTSSTGGNQSNPRNVAVQYYIKYA